MVIFKHMLNRHSNKIPDKLLNNLIIKATLLT